MNNKIIPVLALVITGLGLIVLFAVIAPLVASLGKLVIGLSAVLSVLCLAFIGCCILSVIKE